MSTRAAGGAALSRRLNSASLPRPSPLRSRSMTATAANAFPLTCCKHSAISSVPTPTSESTNPAASSSIPTGPDAAAASPRDPTTHKRDHNMNYGLAIPPRGALDFLSLGALIHRLDPGIIPFRKANQCQIHVSGGEFNVAAHLGDCF